MTITAITCTYQRPRAMELCRKYMARQTRQPDQWIILDGPDRMQKKVLDCIERGEIKGEVVVWFEDDDWVRADWLAWCHDQIAKGYECVGEGMAVYYNVSKRWWSECRNVRHAALCQTAVHRDLLEPVANVIKSYDWPFFDVRIWNVECNKHLFLPKTPAERRVVGIKGIKGDGGSHGYSGEHRDVLPQGTHADPSMLQLHKWVGRDALNYSQFHKR